MKTLGQIINQSKLPRLSFTCLKNLKLKNGKYFVDVQLQDGSTKTVKMQHTLKPATYLKNFADWWRIEYDEIEEYKIHFKNAGHVKDPIRRGWEPKKDTGITYRLDILLDFLRKEKINSP